MTIRRKLLLGVLFATIAATLFGIVVFKAVSTVIRSDRNVSLALSVAKNGADLERLTLLYSKSGTKEVSLQWHDQFERIDEFIKQIELINRNEVALLQQVTQMWEQVAMFSDHFKKGEMIVEKADVLATNIRAITTLSYQLMEIIINKKQQLYQKTRFVLVSLVIFLVSLIFLTAIMLHYDLLRPLKDLQEGAERIGSGTLDYRLSFSSKNELGQLGESFNQMADNVQKVTEKLNGEILEHQETENQLKTAKEKAEVANQAKSTFLANMSHEIRTPLNSLLGLAEVLCETELSKQQKGYVDTISKAGEALLCVINAVLDVSKIEANQFRLDSIPFDLRHTIENTCEIIRFHAHKKGLELLYYIHDDLPLRFQGDPERLKQVLVNLIGNAIKFTDTGEICVEVSIETSFDGWFELLFMVKDTGIGIPEEKQASIFNSFTQADTSITRQFGGTGLGLSIVKRIVELMGGNIWVESEPGKGSCFYFSVRLKSLFPDESSYPDCDLSGLKVLIVDDNPMNLLILQKMLESQNIKVVEATNAKDAILENKKACQHDQPFDYYLLDYNMPDVNGIQLAKILSGREGSKGVTILLSSSGKEDFDGRNGTENIKHCLTKPVKQDDLLACLQVESLNVRESVEGKDECVKPLPLRILLAEDSEDNVKLFLLFLKKLPYQIDIAKNGKHALEKFKINRYNLILMDIEMPEMDGLTATREIRRMEQEKKLAPTPILALTAHALTEHRLKSFEAGCNGHLTKPVKKGQLLESITEFATGC